MSFVGPRPEVADYVSLYTPLSAPGAAGAARHHGPGVHRFRNENDLLTASTDPNRTYIEQIMPRKIDLDLSIFPTPRCFMTSS